MDIYVIQSIWATDAAVQFVETDEPTARQLFQHLIQKRWKRTRGTVETETFDWQEKKSAYIDDGEPIEFANVGPDVIERATVKDKDGQTVETIELYRAIVNK